MRCQLSKTTSRMAGHFFQHHQRTARALTASPPFIFFRATKKRPHRYIRQDSLYLLIMIAGILDKAPKWRCLIIVAAFVTLGLSSQKRVLSVVQDNPHDFSSDARVKRRTVKRRGAKNTVDSTLLSSAPVNEKPAKESDYRFVICTRVR